MNCTQGLEELNSTVQQHCDHVCGTVDMQARIFRNTTQASYVLVITPVHCTLTQNQCKSLAAPLRQLQVSVEMMQRDNLLASSCQWNEQLSQQTRATQEFTETSSKQLDQISSSVELLFNEQLIEDKPTGKYNENSSSPTCMNNFEI